MASTVNVPVFGQVSKGKLAGVLVGGAVVSGYLIYRKQKTAKTQAAAAQAAAAQAASAYGANAYGYGSGFLPQGYYGYGESGGFSEGYYGYGTPAPNAPLPIANGTNAQWAQAAINQLTQEGYQGQVVSAALGAYETGSPVTPAQQGIIQSAIGIEGYPPNPGANGYPPSINVQGTPGGGTGGGQTGTGIPNVTGQTLSAGTAALSAAGFNVAWVQGKNGKPLTASAHSTAVITGTKMDPDNDGQVVVSINA